GSGKTSLALDTLYAEGQRRYIESFSLYTRQFLQRLDKPAAERIDGIPAAIAVTRNDVSRSNRATIGTATEIVDYLRLLYAKVGQLVCPQCGVAVERFSPQSAAERLGELPEGTRLMIGFMAEAEPGESAEQLAARLQAAGFVRMHPHSGPLPEGEGATAAERHGGRSLQVIVDRLTAGAVSAQRLRDSLETAFNHGGGRAVAFVEAEALAGETPTPRVTIDDRNWQRITFSTRLECPSCHREFADPEPRRLSFNSPLGACPTCEGFGNVSDLDMALIVPDPSKSIREGAIAPWNTPAYKHELEELLALAPDYGIPVHQPFSELSEEHLRLIREGVPERNFGGLRGFFRWLEKRKYKLHLRVYLNRWRSSKVCPTCSGKRLNEEALAWRIGGLNIAELTQLAINEALEFLTQSRDQWSRNAAGRNNRSQDAGNRDQWSRLWTALPQIRSRLGFLQQVGLGYLSLDRTLRTLSGGEGQRVSLTSALGSGLVNMLYVLDEPSVGLHPSDVQKLVGAIQGLRDRGNSVVVVEHEEGLLRAADQLIEIGPGAGDRGGTVVFQGSLDELLQPGASLTGEFLAGRRGISIPEHRRPTSRGRIKLLAARGHNLQNLTVDFPLGCLCVVTGVSGSGKSSLVQETLYGAICRRKKKDCEEPLPYDEIVGDGQIDDVVLVDQSPIGRSPRSNPVTYIKAFDPIRAVFADTVDAKMHNYTAGHFSFNVEGGRCDACQGEGYTQVDMQFLADIYMKCGQCGGTRYRQEILAVKYRGQSIADVLAMTVREAFSFFRSQQKVQARLKQLIDVGLDYLQLGQPANTLSAGEAQRLKLAAYLSAASKSRTLFLLDEPTTGLHPADVVTLLDCFDALLAVGHSLVVVEHNLQLMRAADHLIDLGPGAGDDGGRLVAQGTPEEVARCPDSITGRHLAESFVTCHWSFANSTTTDK
ncbi:MAG TPA: excinuclease ABC subunit UvrA, partial [Pirellulaceae bacterium]|nr:excinuclease ABC subunit UvrA [Pirellulaceae bacterium]